MRLTYQSLEHVAEKARPYPAYMLRDCETGLALFSAAFLGHNDAIHYAMAGMKATCVDIDGERIEKMRALYPHDWQFHQADAWEFAQGNGSPPIHDAVSVDTFTGEAMERSLASLDLWCSLARKLVTVTVTEEAIGTYRKPEGWRSFLFLRAPDIYWLVMSRGENARGEL